MKTVLCGLILLSLANSAFAQKSSDARIPQGASVTQVPKGFSYPEAPATIVVEKPIPAKSLSGKVADPTGGEITKALVERMSADWEERLGATFTDANGKFSFSNMPQGIYYLKISYPGFGTLRLKVTVKKSAKSELSINLEPSA